MSATMPSVDAWNKLDGVDLFAEYDKAVTTSEDGATDPHVLYDELREQGMVQKIDVLTETFKLPYSMAAPNGNRPVYTFFGYEPVLTAYRHPEVFSSTVLQESIGRAQGKNLIQVDPPEHTRLRKLLAATFSKKQLDHWKTDVVEPIVANVMADIVSDGEADLMAKLALWLPIRVVHEIIGLDADKLEDFHRLAVGLQLIKTRPDLALASSAALAEMLGNEIAERRSAPGGDSTIDVLIDARVDGEMPLTDDEILAFLRVLLPAGGETTTRALGSLLVGLLNDPRQLDSLREDRSLLPWAIEEAIRWESPTQFNYRITLEDTELDGVQIPAGSGINLCLAAANRDPSRWEDPHSFDIHRTRRAHVAFGFGAHTCIGMHLARVEVQVAMNAILDRMPNLRIDDGRAPLVVEGTTFRWPKSVPVRWDV
ncbi:cytochrome P450 [Rhodococcus opacus]|nr:cytochrome P450 [Rhodococcus opacus]